MTQPRSREHFNDHWKFYLGDIDIPEAVKSGFAGGLTDIAKKEDAKDKPEIAFVDEARKAALDPQTWRELSLPHDWCIEGDFKQTDDGADSSHGYLPRGVGYYRKEFSIPASDKGRRLVLEFDGVFRNSRVWLNGHILKDHRSGYVSFQVDLSDQLRYGDEGLNCLLVRVDARDTEGWWYEGCGIYRHVWLRKTAPLHVATWGTYVTTPEITASHAKVVVQTEIDNEASAAAGCTLVSTLMDAAGKTLASAEQPVNVEADGRQTSLQTLELKAPALWSPETPSLYTLHTELKRGAELIDSYDTPFGVRHIEFKPDGFYLNGKHTAIKGTCNHQDFAGVGVALPDSLHEHKIRLLKQMGSNAYRCAHHMPAAELLDACDRLGMLVMDENRQLDSSDKGLADLEAMLLRDRNHPSIILWSMENEEPLQGSVRGARIVETLVRRTKRLDPTRPTVSAMNHDFDKGGYFEKMDLTGLNYGHKDGGADLAFHRDHPGRRTIGTETCACCTTRGEYLTDAAKGYLNAYGTAAIEDAWLALWTCQYEVPWKSLVKNPQLTGMFVWSGFDYRGEPSPYKWPCIHSHFGIMDTCGFPKDEYYYYKAAWSSEPVLHLLPHWNWAGQEGRPVKVWAFSNCAEVELFLNGRSLGKKPSTSLEHTEWMVPYEPGELKAVGKGGLGGSLETVVKTTGAPASIRLAPYREKLAGKDDAVAVRAEIVDAQGLVVPGASNLVRFKVQGAAEIIGVGNGDPSCHERDKAQQRSAFHGLCLAVVQAHGGGGVILKAEADGLKGAEISL
jgi:beta-galactosidase